MTLTTTCLLLTCRSTAGNVSGLSSYGAINNQSVTIYQEDLNIDKTVGIPVMYAVLHVHAAPMGSISSMEVNVDVLEQMDLMDISDQEALDVFLNSGSGADEGALASPLAGALTSSES